MPGRSGARLGCLHHDVAQVAPELPLHRDLPHHDHRRRMIPTRTAPEDINDAGRQPALRDVGPIRKREDWLGRQ